LEEETEKAKYLTKADRNCREAFLAIPDLDSGLCTGLERLVCWFLVAPTLRSGLHELLLGVCKLQIKLFSWMTFPVFWLQEVALQVFGIHVAVPPPFQLIIQTYIPGSAYSSP
jgi:hypothetical protein